MTSVSDELSKLRARLDAAERMIVEQNARIQKLLDIIESLQSGHKRQAAPFSKGPPKPDPKTPGRKSGDAYDRHAHRSIPSVIDETYEAPLPLCCPHCNGDVNFEKIEPQYQTEIPRRPIHRQFNVHVGCLPAYREIQIAVKNSAWVVPDETGWKVGGLLQWLHAFVTAHATLYLIRPSRGFDVPEEALGADYSGDMTHDGWSVYERFFAAHHGACNGHLFVRSNRLLETATAGAVNFPRQIKALLHAGLAVRDARDAGRISLFKSAVLAEVLTSRLQKLCGPKMHPGNERFAKFLHWNRHDVFRYLSRPNLQATNWLAEQALRPAVVNRKVWGGNRTQHGAEAQGRLASVLRTCWQRGLHTLDFLAQTLRAPPGTAPQLLPTAS